MTYQPHGSSGENSVQPINKYKAKIYTKQLQAAARPGGTKPQNFAQAGPRMLTAHSHVTSARQELSSRRNG